MGPVRQNPIQRTVRSVHMCVHWVMSYGFVANFTLSSSAKILKIG